MAGKRRLMGSTIVCKLRETSIRHPSYCQSGRHPREQHLPIWLHRQQPLWVFGGFAVASMLIESPIPLNLLLSISHSIFVKGDSTNFEIKTSFGVEASELYPEVKYTSVDEYMNQFVQNLEHSIVAIC
ncbi:isoflavone reductase-like protein [Fagus crenata]